MGPIILLDKSSLQSLSQTEIYFLFKHYYVVVPPILIIEILADLKKNNGQNTLSKDTVKHLSNKLLSMDSQINAYYKDICISCLLGDKYPLDGRIIVSGGVPIETKTGEMGIFHDEPPERKALRKWQDGIFSDSEQILAQRWRDSINSIKLEELKQNCKSILDKFPQVNSLGELEEHLERVLSNAGTDTQSIFISGFINELKVHQRIENAIRDRWAREKFPSFRDFAPYSYHCFKIDTLFTLGVGLNLINTRPTNQIDLEYLYYLPFCMVFSSGDKFHRDISSILLRNDQVFVERDILKNDLAWLSSEWNNLRDNEKQNRAYDYGSYPPDNPNSITCQLWKKYMKPWTLGSGNKAIKMTEEENDALIKQLKPVIDAIDEYKRKHKQDKE